MTTLLEKLKTRTQPEHREIEKKIDLFARVKSEADHVALLKKYYGFLVPLEEKISQIPELESHFNFDKRKKVHLLELDFDFFKISKSERDLIPRWDPKSFWEPLTISRAVGILYVLEGSTLGGKIIAEQMKKELSLKENEGLRYYASYGDQLGSMWKSFRENVVRLENEAGLNESECVTAAIVTFREMGNWLARER